MSRTLIITIIVLMAYPTTHADAEVKDPYETDNHTLHLYHFDRETKAGNTKVSGDQVTSDAKFGLVTLNGASLTSSAYGTFGKALSMNAGRTARAATSKENSDTTFWNQKTGAFTYEAIVRMSFDPRDILHDRIERMQIMSLDSDGRVINRQFQFSFRPIGVNGATAPSLEFLKLGSGHFGPRVQTIVTALPNSGIHAPIPKVWFHVAVTYDGDDGKPENLKFYWTRLTDEVTAANLICVASLDHDLAPSKQLIFCVGNSANVKAGANENWDGEIDEVRISDIDRSPDDFLFFKKGGK